MSVATSDRPVLKEFSPSHLDGKGQPCGEGHISRRFKCRVKNGGIKRTRGLSKGDLDPTVAGVIGDVEKIIKKKLPIDEVKALGEAFGPTDLKRTAQAIKIASVLVGVSATAYAKFSKHYKDNFKNSANAAQDIGDGIDAPNIGNKKAITFAVGGSANAADPLAATLTDDDFGEVVTHNALIDRSEDPKAQTVAYLKTAIRGQSQDAIELAGQVHAYLKANPGKDANLIGRGAGGLLAQESAEILTRMDDTYKGRVRTIGLDTPDVSLFAGNGTRGMSIMSEGGMSLFPARNKRISREQGGPSGAGFIKNKTTLNMIKGFLRKRGTATPETPNSGTSSFNRPSAPSFNRQQTPARVPIRTPSLSDRDRGGFSAPAPRPVTTSTTPGPSVTGGQRSTPAKIESSRQTTLSEVKPNSFREVLGDANRLDPEDLRVKFNGKVDPSVIDDAIAITSLNMKTRAAVGAGSIERPTAVKAGKMLGDSPLKKQQFTRIMQRVSREMSTNQNSELVLKRAIADFEAGRTDAKGKDIPAEAKARVTQLLTEKDGRSPSERFLSSVMGELFSSENISKNLKIFAGSAVVGAAAKLALSEIYDRKKEEEKLGNKPKKLSRKRKKALSRKSKKCGKGHIPLKNKCRKGSGRTDADKGVKCGKGWISPKKECKSKGGRPSLKKRPGLRPSAMLAALGAGLATGVAAKLMGAKDIAGIAAVSLGSAAIAMAVTQVAVDVQTSQIKVGEIRKPPGGKPDAQTLKTYDSFKPGDLIRQELKMGPVGDRHHYAVYMGKQDGIHMRMDTTGIPTDDGRVRVASVLRPLNTTEADPARSDFAVVPPNDIYTRKHQKFSREEIVERALSMKDRGYTYKGWHSNCESWARAIVEDNPTSHQDQKISKFTDIVASIVTHRGLSGTVKVSAKGIKPSAYTQDKSRVSAKETAAILRSQRKTRNDAKQVPVEDLIHSAPNTIRHPKAFAQVVEAAASKMSPDYQNVVRTKLYTRYLMTLMEGFIKVTEKK